MQPTPDAEFPPPIRRRHILLGVAVAALAFLSLTPSRQVPSSGHLDSLVNSALKISAARLEKSVAEVGDTTLFPTYATPQLKWKLKNSAEWTSGFYPGCLWYAYEISGDERLERWAKAWTASLEREKLNTETHDLGFKFMCSYGNGLRFGTGADTVGYRKIMLSAAGTLANRYDPGIGCLRSNWDAAPVENSFPVIIDIMANLELLFWASENDGPAYYADLARNHALTTARDFIRPDGSTYHIVRYDRNTGKVINKGTLQGAGNESIWSRGQAWGQYGMVVAYRYTKDERFLETAVRLTDCFLKNLKEDHVANWDFRSDIQCRDASATCVFLSGLFELVNYVENDSVREYYRKEGAAILAALSSPSYFTADANTSCLLNHSVHYLPINSNVDVPAIFADYYFLEALLRYRAQHQ